MTNKPGRLAHMSGFAVGFLSAGTATAFGIDAADTPYLNEICAYFALFVISVPILLFNANHATESNYFMEDGVGVPVHVQLEQRHIVGREVVRIDCNPNTEHPTEKTAAG
ncbi:uncharacterized protein PFLUO_LOCUS5608 [Penicillium psychrofluorescens]|uniref:uncharacterized protein n=1 Tax=Penicillium psychrofluorescens TaxID=3158075 RepID=UPI003CCD6F0C